MSIRPALSRSIIIIIVACVISFAWRAHLFASFVLLLVPFNNEPLRSLYDSRVPHACPMFLRPSAPSTD